MKCQLHEAVLKIPLLYQAVNLISALSLLKRQHLTTNHALVQVCETQQKRGEVGLARLGIHTLGLIDCQRLMTYRTR